MLMTNPEVSETDDRHRSSLPEGYGILHQIVCFKVTQSDHTLPVLVKTRSNRIMDNLLLFWTMEFLMQIKMTFVESVLIVITILMVHHLSLRGKIKPQQIGCLRGTIVQILSKSLSTCHRIEKGTIFF